MFYFRSGCLLALLLFGSSSSTSADTVLLANGSQSNTLWLANAYGVAVVPPGQSMTWPVDVTGTNSAGRDGTNLFYWTGVPGHDYQVACGTNGPVLVDQSPANTHWYFYGLATSLALGFGSLIGGRLGRIASGGGGD